MQLNKRKVQVGAAAAGGVVLLSGLGIIGVQAASAASGPNASSDGYGPGLAMSKDGSQARAGAPGGPGGPGGHGAVGMRGPGGLGEPIHGETVVKDGDGYKTVQMQSGTITEISSDAVTVESADGFTATYTITGDTRVMKDGEESSVDALSAGDKVHIGGVKADGSVTADHIMAGEPPQLRGPAPDTQRGSGAPNGPVPSGASYRVPA